MEILDNFTKIHLYHRLTTIYRLLRKRYQRRKQCVQPIYKNNLSNRKQLLLPPLLKTCAWLTCDYISIGRNNVVVMILCDLQKLALIVKQFRMNFETSISRICLANDVQIMKWISWHMQQTIREKQTTIFSGWWLVLLVVVLVI